MAPVTNGTADVNVDEMVASNRVMIFSKSYCPFCDKVKELFRSLDAKFEALELDLIENGAAVQQELVAKTGQRTVPNVFVSGKHVGGCDSTFQAHKDGRLAGLLCSSSPHESRDYDLVVIGGGSGGLAASKEAAMLGMKVAVCDLVKPSPQGTTWGLGGTCVNVGCIPKKLMHQTALLGEAIQDSRAYGWEVPETVTHNWTAMVDAVQKHVKSLNWAYRVSLREKKVTYLNAFAQFVDAHTLKTVDKKGKEKFVTADRFLLAMGGRPRYPDIPGAREFCISSDDIFSLPHCPGKTLCVGASYISLECAGFLAGLGLDCTVMVRSILLRGFDQQMAELIGANMEEHGVKFIRQCVPTKIERLEEGTPGRLRVTAVTTDGTEVVDEYNTVLLAVGRDAATSGLGLEKLGVKLNPKNGKVVCNAEEQSSVPHVYAIGDILEGGLELTPVAIQAGRLLARRLYGGSSLVTDYQSVPTTVFTPLEYGVVGLSEEVAIERFGENDVEVFHQNFTPLEFTVPSRGENSCYVKLVCQRSRNLRVLGLHVLGPNAGEVTQGFTVGLRLGATKHDFDASIGIHPTNAEVFTTLTISKSSGEDASSKGC